MAKRGRPKNGAIKEPKIIYRNCRLCKDTYNEKDLVNPSRGWYYCQKCYLAKQDEEKREEELSSLHALVCKIMDEDMYPKLKSYLAECVNDYTLNVVMYYFKSQESYLYELLQRKTFKNKANKLAYFKAVANNNIPLVKMPVIKPLNQDVDYNDFNRYKRKTKRIGMAEIEQAILSEMGDDDE